MMANVSVIRSTNGGELCRIYETAEVRALLEAQYAPKKERKHTGILCAALLAVIMGAFTLVFERAWDESDLAMGYISEIEFNTRWCPEANRVDLSKYVNLDVGFICVEVTQEKLTARNLTSADLGIRLAQGR